MSIKKKIPMLIGVLVLITMAVASTLVYCQTSSKLYDNSKIEMKSLTKSYIGTLEDMIDKEKIKVSGLANEKSIYDLLNSRQNSSGSDEYNNLVKSVSSELVQYVKNQGNLEHAFVVDKTGTIIADSDSHLINTNISDRNYNSEVLKGNSVISETMKSKSTGAQIIIFANPVKIGGKLYGYSAAAVIAKSFSNPFQNLTVSGTKGSYAYLIDEKNNFIFHPESKNIGKPVQSDIMKSVLDNNEAEQGKLNYVNYKYNGVNKIAYSSLIPNLHWTFVLAADKNAILSGARKVTILIISMMLVVAIIAIIVGAILSRKITDPMQKITEMINKMSKLDLDDEGQSKKYKDLIKYKDEIGIMYRSILSMRAALRNVVNSLLTVSEKVDHNALFLNKLTEEVKKYINKTLEETENISAGMQENSATAEEIAASSGEMGNAVNDMANKAEKGSRTSEDIKKRAENLKQSAQQSKNKANTIYNSIRLDLENAIKQSKSVSKIDKLTEAIIDITEQTNLLALNASIEAARAGEAGKGFAVVAEEVKQLAQQSGETANNIKNIVDIVEGSVKKLVESSNNILGFVENTVVKDYDKFEGVANQYNNDSEMINGFMTDLSAVSEELNASIEGIIKAVNEMAHTVSDGAGKVQGISEESNNISEKLENINSTAVENKKSVQVLKDIIEKFSL